MVSLVCGVSMGKVSKIGQGLYVGWHLSRCLDHILIRGAKIRG